ALEHAVRNVQEAGAAGTAEELARRRGQEVAADRAHVDRHLSDGLARVYEIQHVVLAADAADRLDVLHEPRVRRHVRHADDLRRRLADDALDGADVDAALGRVGYAAYAHAEPGLERQELQLVRHVVVAGRQYHVAALER